jgi:hypothetical protein
MTRPPRRFRVGDRVRLYTSGLYTYTVISVSFIGQNPMINLVGYVSYYPESDFVLAPIHENESQVPVREGDDMANCVRSIIESRKNI